MFHVERIGTGTRTNLRQNDYADVPRGTIFNLPILSQWTRILFHVEHFWAERGLLFHVEHSRGENSHRSRKRRDCEPAVSDFHRNLRDQ